MLRGKAGKLTQQFDVLWTTGTLAGLSDAQLLSRFAQKQDATGELAFSELVNRHGPMVLGVCRQILPHSHDVDDAFQATFLVLVRKARSIQMGDSLAPWLYSVAYRTAQRARTIASRYRPGSEEPIQEPEMAPEDAYKWDVRPLLYEELHRLPGKYQAPIVLCHLEGKTHEEAARLLNWPVGTLSGRLSRARRLLRSRLERRGVTVSLALLSTPWVVGSPSLVMDTLLKSTLKTATRFAAAQAVSASVLSLTQGVMRVMVLRKVATVSLAVLLISAAAGGAGAWALHGSPHGGSRSRGTEPASVSRPQTETAPVVKPDASPQSKPQSSDGSQTVVTENGPADCPVTQDRDNQGFQCPIAMAANVLTRMFGHSRETSVARSR